MQIAIHHGIGIDAVRRALGDVCDQEGYILESALVRSITEQCERATVNGGRIDRARYESILNNLRAAVQGKRHDRELTKLIVTVIEDGGLKVKSGWPFNWYRAARREAGMN